MTASRHGSAFCITSRNYGVVLWNCETKLSIQSVMREPVNGWQTLNVRPHVPPAIHIIYIDQLLDDVNIVTADFLKADDPSVGSDDNDITHRLDYCFLYFVFLFLSIPQFMVNYMGWPQQGRYNYSNTMAFYDKWKCIRKKTNDWTTMEDSSRVYVDFSDHEEDLSWQSNLTRSMTF